MKVKVKNYDSFMYREVYEIVEMRDGAIFKTKPTGKFVKDRDVTKLDRTKYTTTSLSTSLLRQPEFELDLMEIV